MPGKIIKFRKRGGEIKPKYPHPIEIRLAELNQTKIWLAKQIYRSPQWVELCCKRKILINPDSLITKRLLRVLGITLDYLILGPNHGRNLTRKSGG